MNIVCAADSGVDRFDDRGLDRAGGIGLNVAVHARRLCSAEDSVFVLAPVGDDAEGRVVRAAVERAGVIDRLVLRAGQPPSSTSPMPPRASGCSRATTRACYAASCSARTDAI